MANGRPLEHVYLSFDGATLVERLHEREVKPPMFMDLNNFIPSRSDKSPSLRPDIVYSLDHVESLLAYIVTGGDTRIVDGIAGATGIYGSNQLIYFTSFVPYGYSDGAYQILCDTHSEGTATGAVGQTKVIGSGTSFDEKAWRGAVVRFDVDDNVYNGLYTGAQYVFNVADDADGSYYMTLAGGDPGLIGEAVSNVEYFGSTNDISAPGDAGSLGELETQYGDRDSLGYNTLYIGSSLIDPNGDTTTGNKYVDLTMATGIHGGLFIWTQVGATDEYYLEDAGGGVPTLYGGVPRAVYRMDVDYGAVYGTSKYVGSLATGSG